MLRGLGRRRNGARGTKVPASHCRTKKASPKAPQRGWISWCKPNSLLLATRSTPSRHAWLTPGRGRGRGAACGTSRPSSSLGRSVRFALPPRAILDHMEADPTKSTAEHVLICLRDLRHIEPSMALPDLRQIREFLGQIRPSDPMERSTAWWELCQLCRELSSRLQDPVGLPRWEAAISATEKWCATLK
jgi:hypothetical protein